MLAFFQGTREQAVDFRITGEGTCTSAAPSNISFPCGNGGDVEAEGEGGMGVVKLVYQPWESFQYYAAFGVGDYTLRVPSATVTNVLTGDTPGQMYMTGLRAVLLPDTEVTPAIAVDAGLSWTRHTFNRRAPDLSGREPKINQALDMTQYQFAAMASKLFRVTEREKLLMFEDGVKLEPYGGVKWSRLQAKLKDLQTGGTAGGRHDAARPFIGLRVPVYKNEGFFAEATFVDGYQYAAGLEIRFR